MREMLDSARSYLKSIDLAFGYMANIPLRKAESDRYVLAWSVIRYIDTIVDSTADKGKKTEALLRYQRMADELSADCSSTPDTKHFDGYMEAYLGMEKASDIKTIDCFKNILRSFELDISREKTILTWDKYDRHLANRSDSVLELYYRLLFKRDD